MGYCRLGLAVIAALCLFVSLKPEPASAASVLAAVRAGAIVRAEAPLASPRLAVHFKKTRSFYCYPRNYWWFYRPYTTAFDGHARCMPYFHYPDGGGARRDRYIK